MANRKEYSRKDLSIFKAGLNTSGVGVNIKFTETILHVIDQINEMGGSFTLHDGCDIESEMATKYETTDNLGHAVSDPNKE